MYVWVVVSEAFEEGFRRRGRRDRGGSDQVCELEREGQVDWSRGRESVGSGLLCKGGRGREGEREGE